MDLRDVSLILSPLLAGALGWMLSRRKYAAEAKKLDAEAAGQRIKNDRDWIEHYKKIAEDTRSENKELIRRMAEKETLHAVELNEERKSCAELMKDMKQAWETRFGEQEQRISELEQQLKK
jgi:hypothetical protein